MTGGRGVREPRWVAAWALAAALAVATVAIAQPRARPLTRPASKAQTDAKSGTSAPTGSSSASPAGRSQPNDPPRDAGPIPAPPTDESPDGGKLSPLNPSPNEFSDAGFTPSSVDYERLLTDIASLRARVAAVSDTLFHSRIAISIEAGSDHGRIAALVVSLDDGVIWSSPPGFQGGDEVTIYDHAAAPGHHSVTVDVERRDDRSDTFRTAQRSRFVVDVLADGRLAVALRLWDDSNMGGDFPADKKGQYELKVRATAKAEPVAK